MKQKMVIRVQIKCEKCRTKAMTIAAATHGVISVAIGGAERNEVVVIGDGVDAACLTVNLSKKLKYARLLTVEEVKEEKKPVEKKPEEKKPAACITTVPCYYPQTYCQSYPYPVVYDPSPTNNCTIM